MKFLKIILSAIRNLPEEIRKLLTLIFLLVAATLLFNEWAAGVSSRLTLSPVSVSLNRQQLSTAVESPPAPLASIADSFKSLEKLVKPPLAVASKESSSSLKRKVKNLIASPIQFFKEKLGKASLYEKLEKVWNFEFKLLWPT